MDTRRRISGMDGWVSACVMLVLFFLPTICQASRISLELSVEINTQDKTWSGHVLATNRGDEAAYDLQASLKALGSEKRSSIVKQLEAGKTWETEIPILEVMDPQIMPGRYPAILQVSYTDSNGHPFSALTVNFFEVHEAIVSQISGELQATPISGKGRLILKLQNMDESPIEASVQLVFPRELVPDRYEEKIRVNARDSVTINRQVRNLSALPGSQYPVFSIIEYDKDGTHFSSKAMATLNIAEPVGLVRSMRVPLLVVLGILVAVVIVLQFRHRRREKGA